MKIRFKKILDIIDNDNQLTKSMGSRERKKSRGPKSGSERGESKIIINCDINENNLKENESDDNDKKSKVEVNENNAQGNMMDHEDNQNNEIDQNIMSKLIEDDKKSNRDNENNQSKLNNMSNLEKNEKKSFIVNEDNMDHNLNMSKLNEGENISNKGDEENGIVKYNLHLSIKK